MQEKNDKFNCSSYFISHYADCMYSLGSILEKNRETKLLVHQILSLQYKAGSHWVSESQSAQRDVWCMLDNFTAK